MASPASAAPPSPAPCSPPPASVFGVSSGFPTSASYLNDVAALSQRLPKGSVFTSSHSVALPSGVSVKQAFDALCRPEKAEAIVMTSPLARSFEALELAPAAAAAVGDELEQKQEPHRHQVDPPRPPAMAAYSDPSPIIAGLDAASASGSPLLVGWKSLAHFKFSESIPLLCGLVRKMVHLEVCQVADEQNLILRYASVADQGAVCVWKWRWITEQPEAAAAVDPEQGSQPAAVDVASSSSSPSSRVLVHEFIVGVIAQSLFRSIAEAECRKASKLHMATYASLPFAQQA